MIVVMVIIEFTISVFGDSGPSGGGFISGGIAPVALDEIVKLGRKGVIIWSALLIHKFYMSVFDNMPSIISANPPIWSIKHFMGFFINLLQPFYTLAIILTGFYIIFVSQSPKNRAKAKFWFGKLIIGLILISISPLIVKLMFYISGTLTKQIMNLADIDLALGSFKAGMGKLWSMFKWLTIIHRYGGMDIFLFDTSLLMMIYIILVIRYIMVGILAVLLPVTILLYSWDITRHMGKTIIEQTIIWTFMQIGWAVGLIVVSISIATLPSVAEQIPEQYIYITSIVFIIASPFMILGVMNWLGFGILTFEIVQAAPLSTGAVVFGETAMEREAFVEEEVVIKPPENY